MYMFAATFKGEKLKRQGVLPILLSGTKIWYMYVYCMYLEKTYRAWGWIIKPLQKLNSGTLTTATGSHKSNRLPNLHLEAQAM